jgi:predicted phosphoribosyltransferase
MIFKNREDAGERLAKALKKYEHCRDAVVVALPRGGVTVGRVVADRLGLPLDLVVTRKISAPLDDEYAIGAVTEAGHVIWNEAERAAAGDEYTKAAVAKQQAEAQRRLRTYRAGLPPRNLRGKTVIIVDDGVATGFTMRAALATVKAELPAKTIVAAAVAPPDVIRQLKREADEVIVLESPLDFMAIGDFYEDFPQLDDQQVIRLMKL